MSKIYGGNNNLIFYLYPNNFCKIPFNFTFFGAVETAIFRS